MIDNRLLSCRSQEETEEDFDRVLALVDTNTSGVSTNAGHIADNTAAIAALKVCTVTFDSDGGSSVAQQIMLNGAKVAEPTPPTKASNTFAGWFNGETEWVFTDPVLDSMTLTAHWTAA